MKELKEKLDTILESPKMWSAFQLTREELEQLRSLMGDGWVRVSDKKTPDKEGEYIVYLQLDEICSVVPAYWPPYCGWSIGFLNFDPTIYITHWRNPYSAPTP